MKKQVSEGKRAGVRVFSLTRPVRGGGGTRYIKKVGMFVEILKLTPKGDQSGRGSRISSRATLSETSKAKNIGNFSSTP